MSPERLLTPEEAAERLGLSPVTVGHMLRRGELPGVKVGRLWRFREVALDEYIRGLEAPVPRPPNTAAKAAQAPTKASEAARKANASRGTAGRSAAAKKANETRGPEGRRAAARKAAATLAAKRAAEEEGSRGE